MALLTPFIFESAGDRLAGTLSQPDDAGTSKAVLLFSGSGPQDRDETVAGQKPFAVLAEYLVTRGLAVLRWDDRGVGASTGDYLATSASQLVDDGLMAMQALQNRHRFEQFLLLGHSQGTLIASRLAAMAGDRVSGLILLAGMVRPGAEVLIEQHRMICLAEGWPEADIAASILQKQALFDCLLATERRIENGQAREEAETQLRQDLMNVFLAGSHWQQLDPSIRDEVTGAVDDLLEWEWRFLLTEDPAVALCDIRCPVLAMAGDRDTQVNGAVELALLRSIMEACGNQQLTTHLLPNYNHLFQPTHSGAISDYEQLGRPFGDEALLAVDGWLAALDSIPA